MSGDNVLVTPVVLGLTTKRKYLVSPAAGV